MRKVGLLLPLLGLAMAAPFIYTQDSSPKLSKFLQTTFCKTYGCQFQARVVDNQTLDVVKYDFGLTKLSESAVQVETLAGDVIGLEMNLSFRKSLSKTDLAAMDALVQLARGQKVPYDFAKACQTNHPGTPKDAGKINGFLFQINCYRLPGVEDGTWEYNLKVWLPG